MTKPKPSMCSNNEGTTHRNACDCREAFFAELGEELARVRKAIKKCLKDNAHLADGDDCTLAGLKKAMKRR